MLDGTFPLVRWNAVESALQNAQSIADLNGLRSKIETLHVLSKQSHQSLATQRTRLPATASGLTASGASGFKTTLKMVEIGVADQYHRPLD